MPNWNTIVTKIKETDPVAADIVNTPINQLAERTNYLKAILEQITASEFNYLSYMPVSAVAKVGQAVYWDSDNRRFGQTLAGWGDDLSPYGSLLPSQPSYMTGILVSKHTGNTGAIVISGYISDFQNLEELFGTPNPEAGIYYVSGDNKGQLTSIAPPMTIPAVMYDGEGNILFLPTSSIVSQHDHHEYELINSLWIQASEANFPDMDIPVGADWGYNISLADPKIKSLFTLYTGTGSFVLRESGTILNDDYIEFTHENIWIKNPIMPVENIIAHIAYPNAHGPNIVRAVTTDTPEYISFLMENGLLTITMKALGLHPDIDESFIVVKDIVNNLKQMGPVVTKIAEGPGIVIDSQDDAGHGSCILSLASETDRIIDADIVNLNNAIQRTDGGLVYSVFPANRPSSMTLVANAGKWAGADRQLKIRLWIKGTTSVTPEFNLEIFVFPKATTSGVTAPTVFHATIPAGAIATDSGKYYLCEVDLVTALPITSESQIQYNIEPSVQPTQDYLILRQGITTYVATP